MEYKERKSFPITQWAAEDRPREKMTLQGTNVMSNTELMAIIFGSGTGHENAVELSRRVLSHYGGLLHNLEGASIAELITIKGVGPATAARIKATFALGRRLSSEEIGKKPRITSSQKAWELIQPYVAGLKHEEFWISLLNRANNVLKTVMISKGGITGTLVDSKIIYSLVVETKASGLILFHNHPSGNIQPSDADIILTKKICHLAKMMDVKVLDHIIAGVGNFFSFADKGILPE